MVGIHNGDDARAAGGGSAVERPHLRGVHAAVRLADVDDRHVERGEDIHADLGRRQEEAEDDGEHADHDGDRVPQREADGIHGVMIPGDGDELNLPFLNCLALAAMCPPHGSVLGRLCSSARAQDVPEGR